MTPHDRIGHFDREACTHERWLARVDRLLERLEAGVLEGQGFVDGVVPGQRSEEVAEGGVHGEVGRFGRSQRVRVDGLRPRVGCVHGAAATTQVLHQQRAPREACAAPMPQHRATGAVDMAAQGWGDGLRHEAGSGPDQPGDW